MVEASNTDKVPKAVLQEAELQLSQIWEWLENVHDPEVPVLSVLDLGVVRSIILRRGDLEITSAIDTMDTVSVDQIPPSGHSLPSTEVRITPTYTGCPAMGMIAANIQIELLAQGIDDVKVVEVLSPAWTTNWMRESGKQKLLAYGIAPPQHKARLDKMLFSETPVACPLCGSKNTECISAFGSTACKSLYRCLDCREPFDYFKCH